MSSPLISVLRNLKTEPGNHLLEHLKSEGWKVKSQYSPFAFDKGIDYDSYTLVRDGLVVHFEWDNWFEWTLTGPEAVLAELMHRFGLPGTLRPCPVPPAE